MIEKFLILFIYKDFLTLFRNVFYLMDTSVDTIANLPVRMLACILHCSALIVSKGYVTGTNQDYRKALLMFYRENKSFR